MAKHDKQILKFLTKNAASTPTITEMMMRLKISITDISASLDSLMAQGLVGKRLNDQEIECWFPSAPGGGGMILQSSAPAPGRVDAPAPAASVPYAGSVSYPPLAAQSSGVGMGTFLIGLLAVGAAGAWIGGRILARDTVKIATRTMVDQKMFNEAINSWAGFEDRVQSRAASLEAKVNALSSALDSLKAAKTGSPKPEIAAPAPTPEKSPSRPARRRR